MMVLSGLIKNTKGKKFYRLLFVVAPKMFFSNLNGARTRRWKVCQVKLSAFERPKIIVAKFYQNRM